GRSLPADAAPQHVTFLAGRAFVTSGAEGTLRVYDEPSGRLLHATRIPVGSYNVQFAAGRLLTPSLNAGTLCVLDAEGRLRERVEVPRPPTTPASPARSLFRMRIIAGSRKGHTIHAPRGDDTRPTSDRVRENVFNLVGPVDGADVLDLFAGSGAMGLE